jgi:hypothetical protein
MRKFHPRKFGTEQKYDYKGRKDLQFNIHTPIVFAIVMWVLYG